MESPAQKRAFLIIPEAKLRQERNGHCDTATFQGLGWAGNPICPPPGGTERGVLHVAVMRPNDTQPLEGTEILLTARIEPIRVESNVNCGAGQWEMDGGEDLSQATWPFNRQLSPDMRCHALSMGSSCHDP